MCSTITSSVSRGRRKAKKASCQELRRRCQAQNNAVNLPSDEEEEEGEEDEEDACTQSSPSGFL